MNYKSVSTYVLSGSLALLAGAIVFFTLEVRHLSKVIPSALQNIIDKENNLEPILAGIKSITQQIPEVLKESQSIRLAMPAALKSLDQASLAVGDASKQIGLLTPMIPRILDEVTAVRVSIPEQLEKAQGVVDSAKGIAKDAGSNVLTGAITGIIKAPFQLVGDIGTSIGSIFEKANIQEDDREIITTTIEAALAKNNLNELHTWENKTTKSSGSVKVISKDDKNRCRSLVLSINQRSKAPSSKQLNVCKSASGTWELK